MADLIEDGSLLDGEADPAGTPWHFWAVAAVCLLFNSIGALNYTMTQLRNPAWIGKIDEETLAKIDAAPLWATSCWALGVWGSFVGAVLLLIRSGRATSAFAVSFVAAVISFSWQYSAGLIALPVLPTVILIAVAFFWWYAVKMRDAGVLR